MLDDLKDKILENDDMLTEIEEKISGFFSMMEGLIGKVRK